MLRCSGGGGGGRNRSNEIGWWRTLHVGPDRPSSGVFTNSNDKMVRQRAGLEHKEARCAFGGDKLQKRSQPHGSFLDRC